MERLDDELSKYKLITDPDDVEQKRQAFEARKKERILGVARPWTSRQPSEHGCSFDQYECMDRCGDWENEIKPTNLFEVNAWRVDCHNPLV